MQLNHTKYLSVREEQQIRSILRKSRFAPPRERRDETLIELALDTGARASELLAIRGADVISERRSVFIKGLKGSLDREIPLRYRLFKDLTALGEHPFPISYKRLFQIWDYWRPFNKKFHALRHTFAINLYKKTSDIKLVQLALGHRNLASTQIYMDYVYSQKEMRKLLLGGPERHEPEDTFGII